MLDVMEGGPKYGKWYGEDPSVGKDLGEAMKKKKREKKEENEEEEAVRNDEEEMEHTRRALTASRRRRKVRRKEPYTCSTPDRSSRRGCYATAFFREGLDVKVACENVEAESARYGIRRRRGFRKRRGIETVVGRGEIGDCSMGSLTTVSKSCKESGVKHIVLLSTAKASKGNVLSMLLEDEGARARNDDKREQLAKSLDIPLTIIRPVNVVDEPEER